MKIFILAILVTVIAITAMAFTACTKKRETQTATAVTAGSYAKILNGDLSDFAGTWVDGFGTKSQLRADGVFTSGSMGDLKADGFSMHDYGAYVWNVRDGDGYGGFGVMVYPPGVPINLFYMDGGVRKIAETIETDTTKVRITAGQEGPYSSAEVYYRESESLTQTHNADEYEGYPGEDYEALPLGFGYPYTAILEGDLSEFAGTWVNKRGGIYPLKADGVFDGGLNAYEFTRGADKNSPYITNGTNYEWLVNMGGEAGVFDIWLFPAGVDIKNRSGEIIQTDKTKDRIMFEYITTSNQVYYREGEAAVASRPVPTVLVPGSSIDSHIKNNEEKWYSVAFTEGVFLVVETIGSTDTVLKAYDQNYQFIAENDDDEDQNAKLWISVMDGHQHGTYIFCLTSNGSGNYRIIANLITHSSQ